MTPVLSASDYGKDGWSSTNWEGFVPRLLFQAGPVKIFGLNSWFLNAKY
jgi:hypothetical protein